MSNYNRSREYFTAPVKGCNQGNMAMNNRCVKNLKGDLCYDKNGLPCYFSNIGKEAKDGCASCSNNKCHIREGFDNGMGAGVI